MILFRIDNLLAHIESNEIVPNHPLMEQYCDPRNFKPNGSLEDGEVEHKLNNAQTLLDLFDRYLVKSKHIREVLISADAGLSFIDEIEQTEDWLKCHWINPLKIILEELKKYEQ